MPDEIKDVAVDGDTPDIVLTETDKASPVDDSEDAHDAVENQIMDALFGESKDEDEASKSEETEDAGDSKAEGESDPKPKEGEAEAGTDDKEAKETDDKEEVKAETKEAEVETSDAKPTSEELEKQLVDFNEKAVDYLVENLYALSDEEAELLETDPAKALPRLAATMHLQVLRAASNNVLRLLPEMIESLQVQKESSTDLETQFYKANTGLDAKDVKQKEAVMKVGAVYRQLNPKATAEEFIRDVGGQVSYMLNGASAPVAAVAKLVQQQPKPAGAGGQLGGPVKAVDTNEFALLSQEPED